MKYVFLCLLIFSTMFMPMQQVVACETVSNCVERRGVKVAAGIVIGGVVFFGTVLAAAFLPYIHHDDGDLCPDGKYKSPNEVALLLTNVITLAGSTLGGYFTYWMTQETNPLLQANEHAPLIQ